MVRAAWLSVLALVAAAAPGVGHAQFQPIPATPYYAINPTAPLRPRGDSPVQQQVLQNYRTQLQQTQRDLLQQNPSGLGRDQLEIGRRLNAYDPNLPAAAPVAPSRPPSFNLAPFSPSAIVSPPFNAAQPP